MGIFDLTRERTLTLMPDGHTEYEADIEAQTTGESVEYVPADQYPKLTVIEPTRLGMVVNWFANRGDR